MCLYTTSERIGAPLKKRLLVLIYVHDLQSKIYESQK